MDKSQEAVSAFVIADSYVESGCLNEYYSFIGNLNCHVFRIHYLVSAGKNNTKHDLAIQIV